MDNHHKRRFVTSSAADDDIITNLSDDLINPILDRLPIEDAVGTSVLAKKWRYRWTTMRKLNFSPRFSKRLSKNGAFGHNGFVRVINKIMIYHKGPIFKFHLHIPFDLRLDSFQEVDQWMLILSRKSVKELLIINTNRIYPNPSSVFSCLELRVLVLYNCIFKPPLEFQGFPNLEELSLKCISFGDNLSGTVINLPQLKSLTLDCCINVNNLNVKAEKMQCLHVFLAAEKFPKQLPHAVKCLRQLEFHYFYFGGLDQVQGALCMLRNSPNLEVLRVTHLQMEPDDDLESTSNYLESPDCLGQTLSMLQTVEITFLEGSRPELLFIKLLLDHSPNLEKMIIRPKATDAEKRLNIAKDVMMFPRASSKAKMIYLNAMW